MSEQDDDRTRAPCPNHPCHFAQRLKAVGKVKEHAFTACRVEEVIGIGHRDGIADAKFNAGLIAAARAGHLNERITDVQPRGQARRAADFGNVAPPMWQTKSSTLWSSTEVQTLRNLIARPRA